MSEELEILKEMDKKLAKIEKSVKILVEKSPKPEKMIDNVLWYVSTGVGIFGVLTVIDILYNWVK